MKQGFTLIELLVVIGVFLAVSAVVGGILFSTLRGSQKTTTLDQVRQNGNFALSTMAKNIRGSTKIISSCYLDVSVGSIQIETKERTTLTYTCDMTNKRITVNENSLTSSLTSNQVAVQNCSFTCYQQTGKPPSFKIRLTLSQREASSFVESTASVDFETTVTPRNITTSIPVATPPPR